MLKRLAKKVVRPRLLRFAAVGLSGIPVNLGMLWVFADYLGWPLWLSSPIAIEISIVWNFLLNDAWTFRDKKAGASAGFFHRAYRYNLVSLVGLAIQWGTALGTSHLIVTSLELDAPGLWKYPAQLTGIAVAMAWNFASNFYFTWAQKKPGEVEALGEPEGETTPPREPEPRSPALAADER